MPIATVGNVRGYLTRIWVELVNLSPIPQTAKVRILDYHEAQVMYFADSASGAAALPGWTKSVPYPTMHYRDDYLSTAFLDLAPITIPAGGKRLASIGR